MTNKTNQIISNIKNSNDTIYSKINVEEERWFDNLSLEKLLNKNLIGKDLTGLALRTRAKVVKEFITKAMGYPVPKSFKKTQPRFPAQNLDVYTQQSNNLQIWNEDIDPLRRYAIIQISLDNVITKVRIIDGKDLAPLDRTGTLTSKFQASLKEDYRSKIIVNSKDTLNMNKLTASFTGLNENAKPSDVPSAGTIMPIEIVSDLVAELIGDTIPYHGATQERTRGDFLHNKVSKLLGYKYTTDDGSFPDIKNQLIEVKLQTSHTVDLGLLLPTDDSLLPIPKINKYAIKIKDSRFLIVYGVVADEIITITNVVLINGETFFSYYNQFQGKEINSKIQLILPNDFFK